MARRDTGAPARLEAQLDALAAWASTLGADDLGRPTHRPGARVASVVAGLLGRRDALGALTPEDALLAEVGVISDAVALASALPDHPAPVQRASLAAAVRTSLTRLAERHPGHLVEVRVPPWGAVQVGVPGAASVHRRGTPPNVVECDAPTWLALADGSLGWDDAVAAHRVSASGAHAQLRDLLPVA